MPKNILVFGANSAIAHAISRRFAEQNAKFVLVARDAAKLEANAADLAVRGATKVVTRVADLNVSADYLALVSGAITELGNFDIVVIAHGILPDQQRCEQDTRELRNAIDTNLVSVVSLAMITARELERQGRGTLVVLGSVAGDRGRRSNYVYGASKAGVAVFLEGLRARLVVRGVHVLTVKPGFIVTPMTAQFTKGPIWATPERVAGAICRAIDQSRSTIYVPWYWRPIMFLVRALPSFVMTRLRM